MLAIPKLPGVLPSYVIDEEQRMVQISCVIPLESLNLVCSVGILMKYVEKNRLGAELEDKTERIPLLAIKNFSL